MFKFFLPIILFIGSILLIIGALGVKILRVLFGLGKRKQQPSAQEQNHTYSNTENHGKIFGEHEGEYVEFEEIEDGQSTQTTAKNDC